MDDKRNASGSHPHNSSASGSATTEQSGPGAKRGGKARRNRPGPNKRADQRADETPGSWHQANEADLRENEHKNALRPKSKFKPRDGTDFKPGQYPILFDATAADSDIVEIPMATDWTHLANSASIVLECLQDEPSYEKYLSHLAIVHNQQLLQALERQFIAMGVCLGLQNMINTYKLAGRPIGQKNVILRTNIIHIRSLRKISNQLGLVDNITVGEWYTFPSFTDQIDRGIRCAWHIYNATPAGYDNSVDYATSVEWLPVSLNDPSFDIILRYILSNILSAADITYVRITEDLPVLNNANPPWHNAIPAATQAHYAPIFVARPQTANAWLAWVNALPADFFANASIPARSTGPGTYIANDLGMDQQWNNRFQTMVEKWVNPSMNLAQFFFTSDNTGVTDTGTIAQTSEVIESNGNITFQSWCVVPATEASLAGLFPCTTRMTAHHRPSSKRTTTQALLAEKRSTWIKKDAKP